jgi:7-keto-8-aminopelargonate synthetase-like enzyme
MRGDLAPVAALAELLKESPRLRLYIDDAHCTSWRGQQGRGHALDHFRERDRVVVALSLNKAFSAAGGALVFPDARTRDRVRRAGGPMLFSGAIQPPMLGAAVASARLHLSPGFPDLQGRLRARIERVHAQTLALGIPLASRDGTPIAFIPCGEPDIAFSLCHRLRERGVYIAVAVFPGVPLHRSGLRLTVSLHNTEEDSDRVMEMLAEEIQRTPAVAGARRASRGGTSGLVEVGE